MRPRVAAHVLAGRKEKATNHLRCVENIKMLGGESDRRRLKVVCARPAVSIGACGGVNRRAVAETFSPPAEAQRHLSIVFPTTSTSAACSTASAQQGQRWVTTRRSPSARKPVPSCLIHLQIVISGELRMGRGWRLVGICRSITMQRLACLPLFAGR